jgi:hypothetical protein
MPSPNANQKAKDNAAKDKDQKVKPDDGRVTDPARSHRVAIKTPAGPLLTRAMSYGEATELFNLITKLATAVDPVMPLELPDGEVNFNSAHATTWRVIPNTFDKLV